MLRSVVHPRHVKAALGASRYSTSAPVTVGPPPHGAAGAAQYFEARKAGEEFMRANGYDLDSLVEQSVDWGHQDSFKHLNNVLTIRFFETARMRFVESLLPELSEGSEKALVRGEGGIGVILGGISARYRRPVTFPDTLLVAHRPKSVQKDRFLLESVCWSYAQRCVVTTGEADLVTYDYAALKKADMPEDLFQALTKRVAATK